MTIKSIAKLAGVSRGTVDRVLNNRGNVKPEVAERVREIASRLNYRPNKAGRALVLGKTPRTIGVVLNSSGNAFFDPMIEGIRAAEKTYADYSLSIVLRTIKGYDPAEQAKAIDSILQENIDALVFMPVDDHAIVQKVKKVAAKGIPVLSINSFCEQLPYIGCDYISSGKLAAHLMGLFSGGRARVAILVGSMHALGHSQRVSGFSQVCESEYPGVVTDCVLECNDDDLEAFVVMADAIKNGSADAFYLAAAGAKGGLKAIQDLYIGAKKPVIIACDETEVVQKAIANGVVQATISQQPFEQGYQSICAIAGALIENSPLAGDPVFMRNEIRMKYNI